LGWLVLINIRKGEEGLLNHKSKNKIEFIPNNFRFDKNMQGDRCLMMHDATRREKEQEISNNGDFRVVTLGHAKPIISFCVCFRVP
jgi:hypothetical protein